MILQAKAIVLQLGGNTILNNINFSLRSAELVGLIGPNGAGKTSLLKVLANLQQPDSGHLLVNNKPVNTITRKKLARIIGYLPQGAPAHWPLRVRRLVELGRLPYLSPWSRLSDNDNRVINNAMARAEVNHLADRVVSTLSGGERLRVIIARMFATEPSIILADEPIAALDPYHQIHTMELLREHSERGACGVVVMHDLNIAARFCHRLVLINQGNIACDGTPAQVLQPDRLEHVYGIRTRLLEHESGLVVIPESRMAVVSKAHTPLSTAR